MGRDNSSMDYSEHNGSAAILAQVQELLEQLKRFPNFVGHTAYNSSQGSVPQVVRRPTIKTIVVQYIEERSSSGIWKGNTITTNTNYLHRLVAYTGDEPFTEDSLARYFPSLKQLDKLANHYGEKIGAHSSRAARARSETSIFNHKRVIKACSGWAYRKGLISEDPFVGSEVLKFVREGVR
jgi:hypothetical protein